MLFKCVSQSLPFFIQIPMEKLVVTIAACFLVFISLASLSFISCNETQLSYSPHCDSTVPESSVKDVVSRDEFPHDRMITGFFTGGSGIMNQTNSFSYQSQSVRTTDKPGLFYVEGELIFQGLGYERCHSYDSGYRSKIYYRSQLKFGLIGFWLESTGKLCMVGSGSTFSEEGKELDLAVVFKASNFKNSTDFAGLIKGSLESLSIVSNTVSLLFFPQLNSQSSTLFSDDFDHNSPSGGDIPPGLPLSSLSKNHLCDLMPYRDNTFDLKYTKRFLSEKNNNNPFGLSVKELPFTLSLQYLQCSKDEKRLLLLIEFQNSDIYRRYYNDRYDFNPNMTWVGEGKWDESKNQLEIVACRLSGLEKASYSNVHVGDCSLRLSLQYPAIMSIRYVKQVVGQIWSNKTESKSDGFDMVRLEGSESFSMYQDPGIKYNYTKIDRVLKTCPREKPVGNESRRYPDAYSLDRQFDMSIQMSGKKGGWGYSTSFFVGDRMHSPYWRSENPTSKIKVSRFNKVNMSYMIGISPFAQIKMFGGLNLSRVLIFAEGVYDSESGSLCMIGCRDTSPKNQISEESNVDCEILVKFQFPEANSKRSGRYINGSIESTRKNSDPLFFERMELISAAFDRIEAENSLRRMDVEVVLALVSISLASVFVAFQIFHVKRKPEVLSFISISMLLLLTLGYMIPLVLNFEALFSPATNGQNFLHTDIGGLKVEVIVRVVILVAFLLQCRLLQLSWSARSSKENRKEAWRAEMRALFTTVALHMVGIIITSLLGKSVMNKYGRIVVGDGQGNYLSTTLATLWSNLKHYSGLVLDGFLLPQILINLFGNWKENVLCPSFYLGTTLVNLLPHAYDLYRHHNYARNLDSTYIYASPEVEFFSSAWDIIIPIGCLLLALIMSLQQKFGGRFMLPQKYRASVAYEKIPSRVTNEEGEEEA